MEAPTDQVPGTSGEYAGRGAPSLASVVVWVITLVALGMVAGGWRSSLSGLGDQAASADVAAYESGVEALRRAIDDDDPHRARSALDSLRGVTANPASNGEAALDEAWRRARAAARTGRSADLEDPGEAQQVLSQAEEAVQGLRSALER